MQLTDAVELFLLFKQGENLSPRSIRWYRQQLETFTAYVPDDLEVAHIHFTQIGAYMAHEAGRKLSDNTLDARYRALLAFFNWCEVAKVTGCGASPMGHGYQKLVKRPRRGQPSMRYVTLDEYRTLTSVIDLAGWVDYRDYCLLGVLFWCGLRLSEVADLDVVDLDLHRHRLRVRSGKGNKARIVPIDQELSAALMQYLMLRPVQHPSLWLAYDHAQRDIRGRLTPAGVRQVLRRRCRLAGLETINPHAFRHGFAMWALNGGAEMSSVSAMMGHCSERVTEAVYARWLVDGLVREYQEAAARTKGVSQ